MKFKLSDLADYVTEKIDIESIDLDTYISTENMLSEKQGVSIIEKLPNVKRVTRFKKGDTLVSNIRPYFKKIWFANRDGGCSADVLVFRAKDKVKPEFLFCLLFQDYFFNRMVLSSKGTKMPRGDKKAIMETSFEITELENQEKISKIFFDFKEKIELNNQMIATLEELAATLFKRWFVDFEFPDENGNPYKSSGGKMVDSELGEIPEGWEVKQLNEICEVKDGTHDSPKQQISGYPLVTSKHLGNNKIDFETAKLISPEDYKKVNQRSKVDTDDILISMIGTVGRLYFVSDERINFAIKNIGLIKTSTLKEDAYFIFLQLSSDRLKKYVQTNQAGSTQQYISLTNLRKMPIILPEWNKLRWFNEITENISLETRKVVDENANLIEIRNKILPRLLSGELEI